MTTSRSLQSKLGISLGFLLCMIWICAAALTAILNRQTLDEVFDSALQETAQRLLPIAVSDILARDPEPVSQRLAEIREHVDRARPQHSVFFEVAQQDLLTALRTVQPEYLVKCDALIRRKGEVLADLELERLKEIFLH